MIFRAITDENGLLVDLEVERENSTPLRILGAGGPERELGVLAALPEAGPALDGGLPVLLGAGLGHALRSLLAKYPPESVQVVALLDKEAELIQAVDLPLDDSRLLFISTVDSNTALKELSLWQSKMGGRPFLPLVHPFYQRLDRDFYGHIRQHLEASRDFDFWGKARLPRFQSQEKRLLLITSRYFLVGELAAACERLGVAYRLLTLESDEVSSQVFIQDLLRAVMEFKPDAVLTLNHLGVDREGLLTDLLARLELPLASWFVDNPHLVLHLYEGLSSPWLAIFTWDKDNIESLHNQGFAKVFHLPLGTSPDRFKPGNSNQVAGQVNGQFAGQLAWQADVSFVGNSMVYKVRQRLERANLPAALIQDYQAVAAAFAASAQRSVRDFVRGYSPALAMIYEALPDWEAQLAYETVLTWESTRQYRTDCVSRLLGLSLQAPPLIVGDDGWQIAFREVQEPWRWIAPLSYYDELPFFYPCSLINFNTTSMQMKGAVNQRVFDVPAAGAFVLTDWREQMDELFEPGKEIVSYREPGEIPDLIRYYLAHDAERQAIIQAGRKRVLGCHTWEHRLRSLLETMKDVFGG